MQTRENQPGIQVNAISHRNQVRLGHWFGHDPGPAAVARSIPGARWSATLKCWHVPDAEEVHRLLRTLGLWHNPPSPSETQETSIEPVKTASSNTHSGTTVGVQTPGVLSGISSQKEEHSVPPQTDTQGAADIPVLLKRGKLEIALQAQRFVIAHPYLAGEGVFIKSFSGRWWPFVRHPVCNNLGTDVRSMLLHSVLKGRFSKVFCLGLLWECLAFRGEGKDARSEGDAPHRLRVVTPKPGIVSYFKMRIPGLSYFAPRSAGVTEAPCPLQSRENDDIRGTSPCTPLEIRALTGLIRPFGQFSFHWAIQKKRNIDTRMLRILGRCGAIRRHIGSPDCMRRCGLERLTSAHLRDFSADRSFATPAPKPRKSGDPLAGIVKRHDIENSNLEL
ncbi:MAG: hypothetical protein JPMHGGIA_00918 [Saprospiraceae bacterium]|nr:hypothetical protein [Saprospiraceae bacterium]